MLEIKANTYQDIKTMILKKLLGMKERMGLNKPKKLGKIANHIQKNQILELAYPMMEEQ